MPELEDVASAPRAPLSNLLAEAERQFSICNACRYCEGYCAVFPAMEQRSVFTDGDLSYLANLCHDCRACYQACMYTEPHDFAINIPALMADARVDTYRRYARPQWLWNVFQGGPRRLLLVNVVAIAVVTTIYLALSSPNSLTTRHVGPGSLYAVVSHIAMVIPALILSIGAILLVGIGLTAFWRDTGAQGDLPLTARSWWRGTGEAAGLRWLRGRTGCYFPVEERASPVRGRLHHAVAYGFLLTFLATVTAWISETFFDDKPPYPLLSLPVILGVIGGAGIIVGCVGLLAIKRRANRRLTTDQAFSMDVAFLLSLLAVAGTGMLLLLVRDTAALGTVLLIHLGTVAAFYLTAPYAKLVHGAYRFMAILRSVQERD